MTSFTELTRDLKTLKEKEKCLVAIYQDKEKITEFSICEDTKEFIPYVIQLIKLIKEKYEKEDFLFQYFKYSGVKETFPFGQTKIVKERLKEKEENGYFLVTDRLMKLEFKELTTCLPGLPYEEIQKIIRYLPSISIEDRHEKGFSGSIDSMFGGLLLSSIKDMDSGKEQEFHCYISVEKFEWVDFFTRGDKESALLKLEFYIKIFSDDKRQEKVKTWLEKNRNRIEKGIRIKEAEKNLKHAIKQI